MSKSPKVLILGNTGKLGLALTSAFTGGYSVTGLNSKGFKAEDFAQTRKVIEEAKPDIVFNTVAFLGIDPSEKNPEAAFRLNVLFPKLLAELSNELGFLLVHFSSDAVFDDGKGDRYVESDAARPVSIYGMTKYGGDCMIQAWAKRYYIIRVSILFGETTKQTGQFVENMIQKIRDGAKALKISGDIFASPTYSRDVGREVRRIVESGPDFGVYHVVNEGTASLHDLIVEVVARIGAKDVKVEKVSHNDFPSIGKKNTKTALNSEKIKLLRPWRDAVGEYCNGLNFIER
ncbi:MAG: NAD(P)-dependent oxidoreductase [Nitrospinae bacterium]|nr:NAD(P)-dependent oxidoreductase [Nitrospinota bacterium]